MQLVKSSYCNLLKFKFNAFRLTYVLFKNDSKVYIAKFSFQYPLLEIWIQGYIYNSVKILVCAKISHMKMVSFQCQRSSMLIHPDKESHAQGTVYFLIR